MRASAGVQDQGYSQPVPAKWIIVLTAAWGFGLALVCEAAEAPVQVSAYALAVLVSSFLAWQIDNRRAKAGAWFAVAAILIAVPVGNSWLNTPTALVLLPISTLLLAVTTSLPAAVGLASLESALLLVVRKQGYPCIDAFGAFCVLTAIWASIAIAAVVLADGKRLCASIEKAGQLVADARKDRAELKGTRDDLVNLNRQLALMNERVGALRSIAEEAQQTKGAFVASVSHEMRTPLNVIIGMVGLMVETPRIYSSILSPKMKKDLEIVHRNCLLLSTMVNDVLDLTRMEADQGVLHRERVCVAEIIDRSVAAVAPLMENKQLSVQTRVPADLPHVYCDRTRVQQVIVNLLSNAARFTEEGGITVTVVREDQQVAVAVADTGPGIPAEQAESIFEPFWQGGDRVPSKKGGTGLGLSISKEFINRHGGRMWVESELGAGTVFRFTLPISPPIEHTARPGHLIREDWVWREAAFRTDRAYGARELKKPRVLVYDKIGGIGGRLEPWSDEVEFVDVQDLDHVAAELRRCPARLLLTNVRSLDDLQSLVDAARKQAAGTPVVGCLVPRPVKRAIERGALGHLVKPLALAELKAAIGAVNRPVKQALVVDDDHDALELFTRMLHACDPTINVRTASSGSEAVDEVHRQPPDLMLLDIGMPDINGWQVLERIARGEDAARVPTYVVSAQDADERPATSEFLFATMNGDLSLTRLLRCSLEVSKLLLQPKRAPDPGPV